MLVGKKLEFPSCCAAMIFHDIILMSKKEYDNNNYYKNNYHLIESSNDIDIILLEGEWTVCYAAMPIINSSLINKLTILGFIPVDMNQNVNTGNNILLMKYVKEWTH